MQSPSQSIRYSEMPLAHTHTTHTGPVCVKRRRETKRESVIKRGEENGRDVSGVLPTIEIGGVEAD